VSQLQELEVALKEAGAVGEVGEGDITRPVEHPTATIVAARWRSDELYGEMHVVIGDDGYGIDERGPLTASAERVAAFCLETMTQGFAAARMGERRLGECVDVQRCASPTLPTDRYTVIGIDENDPDAKTITLQWVERVGEQS